MASLPRLLRRESAIDPAELQLARERSLERLRDITAKRPATDDANPAAASTNGTAASTNEVTAAIALSDGAPSQPHSNVIEFASAWPAATLERNANGHSNGYAPADGATTTAPGVNRPLPRYGSSIVGVMAPVETDPGPAPTNGVHDAPAADVEPAAAIAAEPEAALEPEAAAEPEAVVADIEPATEAEVVDATLEAASAPPETAAPEPEVEAAAQDQHEIEVLPWTAETDDVATLVETADLEINADAYATRGDDHDHAMTFIESADAPEVILAGPPSAAEPIDDQTTDILADIPDTQPSDDELVAIEDEWAPVGVFDAAAIESPIPEATPVVRTDTLKVPDYASCPYCARLVVPAPTANKRCPQCRQKIMVRRVDDRLVYLTEGSLPVFEAERRRITESKNWIEPRNAWLRLAAQAGAPADRIARVTETLPSRETVVVARGLYLAAVERSIRLARVDRDWPLAVRIRRAQALAMFHLAGSPVPAPADVIAVHQDAAAIELRGIGELAREAELVGGTCCETCSAHDGRAFRISGELKTARLPHADCPRGLCACRWRLGERDRANVERLLRRSLRA